MVPRVFPIAELESFFLNSSSNNNKWIISIAPFSWKIHLKGTIQIQFLKYILKFLQFLHPYSIPQKWIYHNLIGSGQMKLLCGIT